MASLTALFVRLIFAIEKKIGVPFINKYVVKFQFLHSIFVIFFLFIRQRIPNEIVIIVNDFKHNKHQRQQQKCISDHYIDIICIIDYMSQK